MYERYVDDFMHLLQSRGGTKYTWQAAHSFTWEYDYMIILTRICFYYFTDPQNNIHIVTEWIANDVSATKIR